MSTFNDTETEDGGDQLMFQEKPSIFTNAVVATRVVSAKPTSSNVTGQPISKLRKSLIHDKTKTLSSVGKSSSTKALGVRFGSNTMHRYGKNSQISNSQQIKLVDLNLQNELEVGANYNMARG